jgi:hypothetical protein
MICLFYGTIALGALFLIKLGLNVTFVLTEKIGGKMA